MREMTLKEIEKALGYEVKIIAEKPKRQLSEIPVGETFKVGDLEFVVLEHSGGVTAVILKEFWRRSKFDDNTNNYAESRVRKELNDEFYNKLSEIIGSENIIKHTVDLTSDDGRKEYGEVKDYIGLLTCDLFRKYVTVLDKYNPKKDWYLATPYSVKSNGYDRLVRCVSCVSTLDNNFCSNGDDYGVRPFCILKSNIFVSE